LKELNLGGWVAHNVDQAPVLPVLVAAERPVERLKLVGHPLLWIHMLN
jgi:hypothetical protein